MAKAEASAQTWDGILARWEAGTGASLLRTYSDAVNATLLREWLPAGVGVRVLKTDLFDEAVAAGLYPVLHERGAAVVGVDVSPAVVAAAQARYPQLDARVADVRRLHLPDASFDAVVSNSTLDHLSSLDESAAALEEIRRVLVPGGILVVTLDNGANRLIAVRNALPDGLLRGLGLVPYPTGATCGPMRLERLLDRTGFSVDDRAAIMHFPRLLLRVAAAATRPAPERLLRAALAFERLESSPARYLTAQFVAARARRI